MKFIYLKESSTIEFKRALTDRVKHEIIAFANTHGGELYIGIDDDGSIIGLENAHETLEKVSNMLHDSIQPDVLVHTHLLVETIENKEIVKISVSRGSRRPYHLKSKGMNSSGAFIRYGTSVTNASEEGYYINLGLLFSDQCDHSIKCASYFGNDKLDFQDRKEFTGSLLTQIEKVYEYLSFYNAKSAHFEGLKRIEQESFPSYALREALINAVTHRDYSFSGSILIHLFQNRIEIVSVGGLVKG